MTAPGGTFTLADDLTLSRMGYGAMQLAGPGVMGPPRDPDEAVRVLRTAVELGITHLDTSDYYGPFTTNEVIRRALHPYPADLRIVTKVGAVRGTDGSWNPALSPAELTSAVQDNLDRLGLDALDVVNLRLLPVPGFDLEEAFSTLAGLVQRGLIRHLGISEVDAAQLAQAQKIAPVVCVQNQYNLAHREHEDVLQACTQAGIAFVPYFPLGGFSPLQSAALDDVATRLDAGRQQVALAWLLAHAPNILVIPGTSSVAHLRENVAAADLTLPADAVADLDAIASPPA